MLRARGAGVPVRDAAITPKLSARVGVTEKGALPPAYGLPRDIFETEKVQRSPRRLDPITIHQLTRDTPCVMQEL